MVSSFQGVKFKLLFVPSSDQSDQAQHYGGMWNINIQSHSCDGGGGGRGVGIEFHCIQRCPHSGGWNRGVPLYTEVSSFQGVGIEGFHLYRVVLIFQEVGTEFHCIQKCPHFK